MPDVIDFCGGGAILCVIPFLPEVVEEGEDTGMEVLGGPYCGDGCWVFHTFIFKKSELYCLPAMGDEASEKVGSSELSLSCDHGLEKGIVGFIGAVGISLASTDCDPESESG